MKLDGKVRLALAVWAKAILGDPNLPLVKQALAKELYVSGVDGWASKIFVFVQAHWMNPTDTAAQTDVNDIVTSVIDDILKAKSLKVDAVALEAAEAAFAK